MSRYDHDRRELCLKIVYAGPGLSGKTTNLRFLHGSLPTDRRGRLVSLATENDRTLFFDFLPVDVGQVAGFRVRLSLYTIPGQARYRISRALIMRGADAVVFVADSHPMRAQANRTSLQDLQGMLEKEGRSLSFLPLILQYNKRDLPNRIALEDLEAELNPDGAPFVPAVAVDGRGVSQSLKEATRLAIRQALSIGGEREQPKQRG